MAEGDTPEGITFEKVDDFTRLPGPVRKTAGDPSLILDQAAKIRETEDLSRQVGVNEVDLREGLREGDVLWMRDAERADIYFLYNGSDVWGSIRVVDSSGNVTYHQANAQIEGALQNGVLSAGIVKKGEGIKIAVAPEEELSFDKEVSDEVLATDILKYFPPEHKHPTPIVEMRIIPVVPKASSSKPV